MSETSPLKPAQTMLENHMETIQKKSGVNPKVVLGGLVVGLILTTTRWFSSYVTCIIGVLCPTYLSLKALESPEEDDDKQFLTYWVVYGLFSILELFTKFLVKIFPFYYTVELGFLIWLFMPNTRGAVVIYNKIVKPVFLKYESKLEKGVNKIMKKGEEITEKTKDAFEENKDKIIKGATNLVKKVE